MLLQKQSTHIHTHTHTQGLNICRPHEIFLRLQAINKWQTLLLSLRNTQPMYACVLSHFSRVSLFVTPWNVACQAPLSREFSRQEYWSGLPCLPPRDFPDPGNEPRSPALAGRFFTTRASWEAHIAHTSKQKLSSFTQSFKTILVIHQLKGKCSHTQTVCEASFKYCCDRKQKRMSEISLKSHLPIPEAFKGEKFYHF